MSFDPAHQSTLIELARVQRERDDLAHDVAKFRKQIESAVESAKGVDSVTCHYCPRLATCFGCYENSDTWAFACSTCCGHGCEDGRCVMIGQHPQDPVADSTEDAAFADAIRRMEDAEAREDAAERKR